MEGIYNNSACLFLLIFFEGEPWTSSRKSVVYSDDPSVESKFIYLIGERFGKQEEVLDLIGRFRDDSFSIIYSWDFLAKVGSEVIDLIEVEHLLEVILLMEEGVDLKKQSSIGDLF